MWLYFRFPLSFRKVEELLPERGIIVSYKTVRRWCLKFGQAYAKGKGLRRRRLRPVDKCHLDEIFIKVNGEQRYLWRAVDQDSNVLDILIENRRDKATARRFFRCLLKETVSVREWLLPTSSAPTAPPTAKLYPRSSTAPARARTVGPRTHRPTEPSSLLILRFGLRSCAGDGGAGDGDGGFGEGAGSWSFGDGTVGEVKFAAVAGTVDGSGGDGGDCAAGVGADGREGFELSSLGLGEDEFFFGEDCAAADGNVGGGGQGGGRGRRAASVWGGGWVLSARGRLGEGAAAWGWRLGRRLLGGAFAVPAAGCDGGDGDGEGQAGQGGAPCRPGCCGDRGRFGRGGVRRRAGGLLVHGVSEKG